MRIVLLGVLLLGVIVCPGRAETLLTYRGASDPSAATALDKHYFVVGDDEINWLKVYALNGPDTPLQTLDLTSFLAVNSDSPEADIEGAARIGKRIYWITSHGRNKDGKLRPNRSRFFAVDYQAPEKTETDFIKPCGSAYTRLLQDMLDSSELKKLNLDTVTRIFDDQNLSKKQRELLAPKRGGLNIEGLACGLDGQSLLIGLRNPCYRDPNDNKPKAILIPILNPAEVVEKGLKARFGVPILLDLGGRGIRSIDWDETQRLYWISAGAVDGTPDFAFFQWRPESNRIKQISVSLPHQFNPESMLIVPEDASLWLVSDDGVLEKKVQSSDECLEGQMMTEGICLNKHLSDINQRTFRIISIPAGQKWDTK